MSLNLGSIWRKNTNNNTKISNNSSNLPKISYLQTRKITPSQRQERSLIGTKTYWGKATWYLFHAIAARINSEYYKRNYMIVWNFVKQFGAHLPCPYCRTHANNYLKKV